MSARGLGPFWGRARDVSANWEAIFHRGARNVSAG